MFAPNWYLGFLPASWWPSQPRAFYAYTLNILPVLAGGEVVRSVTFSKRVNSLVFGGHYLVTTTDDLLLIEPATGTPPTKLVSLGNPAGNEVFTVGGPGNRGLVPIENLFGGEQAATTAGARVWGQGHGLGAIWPCPIRVQRGADLQVRVRNLNGAANHNVRITFYVAVVAVAQRKAA